MVIIKEQLLQFMNKQCKIHPKTFQKINKQLNNNTNTITNSNNNNNIINNNIIIQLGREKLSEIFTKKEIINILQRGYKSLNYLIQHTHFNDNYPQFKNILITNLQNNLAYKYNSTTNNFDAITKDELLEEIVSERMFNINEFYEEFKDDITDRIQNIIQSFIDKMEDENYEETEKNEIKLIIYNNRNKVTKEISQNLEIVM
jgi:hypothetical protein